MYPSKPGAWPTGNWAWWGAVLKVVSKLLDFFAHYMGGNYALALLALTILFRIIVLPLFLKQIKSTRAMQQLQPEIQKIRSKYKGDNQKIQEETTKLWQANGVNPMAGCFPMLVQLPILYALFGAIEGNKGLNASHVLWIHTLAKPDPYFILPILAGITTYFSSRVMMTSNDPQQRMMLYIMPVFIVLIGSRMAAGLALYWTYSNLFTAVQGYFVRVKPGDAATTSGTAPPGKGEKAKQVTGKTAGTAKSSSAKARQGSGSRTGQTGDGSRSSKGSNSRGRSSSGGSSGRSQQKGLSAQRSGSSQKSGSSRSAGRTGQGSQNGSNDKRTQRNQNRANKNES